METHLNEILIRFKEDGTYQGAQYKNLDVFRDGSGNILFARESDPYPIDTLSDLSDIIGAGNQVVLTENQQLRDRVSQLENEVISLESQIADLAGNVITNDAE